MLWSVPSIRATWQVALRLVLALVVLLILALLATHLGAMSLGLPHRLALPGVLVDGGTPPLPCGSFPGPC